MEVLNNPPVFNELCRLNMNILEASYVKLDNNWVNENARASYCRIYLICKGSAKLMYGATVIPLLPGNIYVIPPDFDFSYECAEYMEKLYFHINVLRPNNYDLLSGSNSVTVLESFGDVINKTVESWNKKDIEGVVYIKSSLYSIFSQVVSLSGIDLELPEEYSTVVKKAIQTIESNLQCGLSAQFIANRLYVSESRLRKAFKRETGVPFGQYVADRVMVAAEEMLNNSDDSIKSISDKLGYCDQFYFSRQFSSKYGISPTKYRIYNNYSK